MCLAIYGVKCNVPYEQVEKDVLEFVPFMNAINPSDPFTVSDAESAMECYDHRYCTFPIKDIEIISAIPIKRNKRNGQKQADHLEEARAIRDLRMKRQGRKWTDGNGRPRKEGIVMEYLDKHPDVSVVEAAKELGVSRPTIYKYKEKADAMKNIELHIEIENEKEKRGYSQSDYEKMRIARLKAYKEAMERMMDKKNESE